MTRPSRSIRRTVAFYAAVGIGLLHGGWSSAGQDIPPKLVADIRVVEARSTAPDFKAMEELSFFIDTDGSGVTELQWLATIARNVQDSFLATLALETSSVRDSKAILALDKRSRSFNVSVDLGGFTPRGVFAASIRGDLLRRGEAERTFSQEIELELGKTYVWSGPGLEFTASEYLSHFRDYSDRDHRVELYDRLREYTTFLVFAVTLRLADEATTGTPVALELPSETELPSLRSPLGIDLVGTIELELDVDDTGAPKGVRVVRSSLPEVNPRLVGEADGWRFPHATGRTGRLILELEAQP